MSAPPQLYRVGRRLGRGAVASVHEVFDEEGRRFAGKFQHASRDGDALAAARFAQEAALLRGLEHPNLVRVDGLFEAIDEHGERREFVRMELVEGIGLDTLIARAAPLPEARVIELGRQLAAGLAYAHGRGIVHRDLKPANILVANPNSDPPTAKIADFGMARASSLAGVRADALTILGTPDYMAPECIDPIAVDARADLYALGCILYELASGEVPYSAATPFGTIARHRDDPVPVLPNHVSAPLRALIEALMAKSPADRPPSAGVVAERLASLGHSDGALVPVADLASSRCASCGHELLAHLSVCLNCGLAAVTLERGDHHVIITGPGEVGDKLDSELRDRLRAWIGDNPQLGLIPGKWLESKIPRLPAVLASSLAQRSARAMVGSLAALGFVAEAHAGMSIKHPLVRNKARKLAGRIGLVAVSTMGGLWQLGAGALAVMGVGAIGAMVGTAIHSAQAVTSIEARNGAGLSASLRAAFDRVEGIAPELREVRHRHALRAVVRQSLDLRASLGPEHADEELAEALVLASATTASLARIDEQLRDCDLNDGSPQTRELLHRRDRLAGRMAELSGALELLRIRAWVARPSESSATLDELRARVEALEEVQAL